MVNIPEALAVATSHHQAGELETAERLYRQVLAVEPENPHALHLMGMLAMQGRRFDAAVDLIARAIRADNSQAAFHANLGEAYRHLGQMTDAVSSYQKAVRMQPQLVAAHSALGNLLRQEGKLAEAADALREALRLKPDDPVSRLRMGQVLLDQNKLDEAESCFRHVLRIEPDHADAQFHLGVILQEQGKRDEAAACYRAALASRPDLVEAHVNLGAVLKEQDSLDEAAKHCLEAIRLKPDHAGAHHNLGTVYEAQQRFDAAVAEYQHALSADPELLAAYQALGGVYEKLNKLDDAWSCFQQVLRRDPRNVDAHIACGTVRHAQYRLNAAIDCYRTAIDIDPNHALAHNNLASALNTLGKLDEGIAHCRRAIELDPGFATPRATLGIALQATGQLRESMAQHRKAVELKPDDPMLHGNLLYLMNYDPAYDAATIFAEHRLWGQRHADPIRARSPAHSNDRSPGRRLRVGYVSGHFMDHAVNFFTEPILASHDHAQFEIYCYSNVTQQDDTTARLKSYSDGWRDIVGMTDPQVVDLVRHDRIDILVDLSGHIGGNRLMVFAYKPAPVQVTYIGYQNTTGMLAMDARITDDYSDPPGMTDRYYTEKLVRLPRSFFCYQPSADAPPITAGPVTTNGFFTFGSFNNFAKVTPQVLAAWARILANVPSARLMIVGDRSQSTVKHIESTMESHGVSRERLELTPRCSRAEYLQLIQRADIALDPFPFNGHTTTCDALWQGVPVVTLSGDSYVSRFGGSALATLSLNELIASDVDHYVRIAVQMAGNVDRLKQLRGALRQRMADSPLLDFAGFTRHLEAAYRELWTEWCGN